MPNGEEENCLHPDSLVTLREGWFEERCMLCGFLIDRWEADKDEGDPRDRRGPA